MSSKLWKKTVTFLTAFMLSLSFLPQGVYAQEEQEPVENTEITENSEPDKDESKAETSSEDKENIALEGNEGTPADYRAEPPAADEGIQQQGTALRRPHRYRQSRFKGDGHHGCIQSD